MIEEKVRPLSFGACVHAAWHEALNSFVDRARGNQSREELVQSIRTRTTAEASINTAGNLCVAVTHSYSNFQAPHLEYFVYEPTTPGNYRETFSTLQP